MASAWPFPCRIKDTGTGDFYYADGVYPWSILPSGSSIGGDLNDVLGNVGSFQATTAQRQNIQNFHLARLAVFAQLAACESCPDEAKAAVERELVVVDALLGEAYAELGVR